MKTNINGFRYDTHSMRIVRLIVVVVAHVEIYFLSAYECALSPAATSLTTPFKESKKLHAELKNMLALHAKPYRRDVLIKRTKQKMNPLSNAHT